MRVSNPLANSYTRNQADSQFLTVDLSGSSSGTANLIDADTLNGKPASDYVLKSEIYPVGSIYISINSTDPSTYFGGTWERIQGRFLLAADDNSYIAGTTGGEAEITLSVSQLPPHRHTLKYSRIGATGSEEQIAWSGGDTTDTLAIENTGSGSPINILPPYLTVYIWKRTA